MRKHRYTPEQEVWLRENIGACNSYEHLAEMFNARFGTKVNRGSVSDKCIKNMHIHRNANTGRFEKGGHHAKEFDIGEERLYDGYIWVKVKNVRADGNYSNEIFYENWIQKHRYVYEKHYGKIQDGHIVVFLDGNRQNFSPDNLYCISRGINAIMNSNKWFTDSREHTLTAIKWCELYFALKGVK